MTQADQSKFKSTNHLQQSSIKDKLEEIFITFGLIFSEEQFFVKFKNNICHLNSIVQDNSLPSFRVICVLIEEFKKIMHSQEKEMLFTITAFYYFLYKNFISLNDEHAQTNRQLPQIPNMINNPFPQTIPQTFPNFNYPFPMFPPNPFTINNCYNKTNIPIKKITNSNNDQLTNIEGNRNLENNLTKLENMIEEHNTVEKYNILGKKQKNCEVVIEISEKNEANSLKKAVLNDKSIQNKEENKSAESKIKEKDCFTYSNKESVRNVENLTLKNNNSKETIFSNFAEKNEKIDLIQSNKHVHDDIIQPKEDRKSQEIAKKKHKNKENNNINCNNNSSHQSLPVLNSCKEKDLNIPEKVDNIVKGNSSQVEVNNINFEKSVNEAQIVDNSFTLMNDQNHFDQQYDRIMASSVESSGIHEVQQIKTSNVLEMYPNIEEENMKVMKSGEISNREEKELMRKIIRLDCKREYEKCFKNSKDRQIVYYFITRILNKEGKEYLLKYDKESCEFNIFEYINNKKNE
jgi:hypothetical protein